MEAILQPQHNLTQFRNNLVSTALNLLSLPTNHGFRNFDLDDIRYIQSDGNYSVFHLSSGNRVIVAKTLKYYDGLLAKQGFLRVHRSFLVNKAKIQSVHRDADCYITLQSKVQIPVSRRRRRVVLNEVG